MKPLTGYPRPAINRPRFEFFMFGRSSAGEHYLDTVGVVGSIPIARTISSYSYPYESIDVPDSKSKHTEHDAF